MKNVLILWAFVPFVAFAQKRELGLALGYNNTSSFQWGLLYRHNRMVYSFGSSTQESGQKKLKSERLANYGTKFLETGKFYKVFDFAIGTIIKDRVTIMGEISIGKRTTYDTYEDKRFNGGGYSLIRGKRDLSGAGASVSCRIFKYVHPYISYNSIKRWGFGVRALYGSQP